MVSEHIQRTLMKYNMNTPVKTTHKLRQQTCNVSLPIIPTLSYESPPNTGSLVNLTASQEKEYSTHDIVQHLYPLHPSKNKAHGTIPVIGSAAARPAIKKTCFLATDCCPFLSWRLSSSKAAVPAGPSAHRWPPPCQESGQKVSPSPTSQKAWLMRLVESRGWASSWRKTEEAMMWTGTWKWSLKRFYLSSVGGDHRVDRSEIWDERKT